ncbi:MAG: WecB/TagA/CpsF family glycosyltransferase, partial [Candidatus Moraniibacteriota bacterium]
QERGKCKIGIVVREDGLSSLEEILVALRKKYPSLDCNGITIPRISISARSRLDANLEIDLQKILDCAIILCSLGAPEQEYFTESLRQNPGNIRVAVGVGGVFDILTGKIKQAPRWISKVGLEWLWRLLQQPRRFRRIFRAVVVFPYTCFIYKKKL